MNTEALSIPQDHMRKLLAAASGDAALLYIFVHSGNAPEGAGSALQQFFPLPGHTSLVDPPPPMATMLHSSSIIQMLYRFS